MQLHFCRLASAAAGLRHCRVAPQVASELGVQYSTVCLFATFSALQLHVGPQGLGQGRGVARVAGVLRAVLAKLSRCSRRSCVAGVQGWVLLFLSCARVHAVVQIEDVGCA
jgi:hypothetical protein